MPFGAAGSGQAAAKQVLKFQGTLQQIVPAEPSFADVVGETTAESCAWEAALEESASGRRGSDIFDDKIRGLLFAGAESNPTRALDLVMCCVIVLNAVIIVLEVDLGPRDPYTPVRDRLFWFLTESLFTTVYLGEIVFRINLQRRQWVRCMWNWLDAVVVIVSVIDCWVLTLLLEADVKALRLLTLLRMVRLARLVRLVRLLRMCRGLYIMVMAFWHAMASLSWIVVLMVLGLLVFATFATVTIGHNDKFAHVLLRGDCACDRFGTVPQSMYTLFELMTLEDWHDIGRPLVDAEPALFLFIFGFIIIFTFGLLNMIVGMVVEKTLVFARQQDDRQQAQAKKRMIEDLRRMKEIFLEADVTCGGEIDLDTFRAAVERNDTIKEILKGLEIPTHDALELFMTLDAEGEGRLTVQKFIEGVAKLRGAISQRWDEMATHAGVKLLLRKAVQEHGEEPFLAASSRSQTPSVQQLSSHPSVRSKHASTSSSGSAGRQRTPDAVARVVQQLAQQLHTSPPPEDELLKPFRDGDDDVLERIMRILESQAEAQDRRHLQIIDRLKAVEATVGELQSQQHHA